MLMNKTARNCERLLRLLSPRAAIRAWWEARTGASSLVSQMTNLNRVIWTIAAGGSGGNEDPTAVDRYVYLSGRWLVCKSVADMFRRMTDQGDKSLFMIDSTPYREVMSRTSSQEIRYHWASRMISIELARQAEADPGLSEILPDFTVSNVESCCDFAISYGDNWPEWGGLRPMSVGSPGYQLARHLAMPAGYLAERPFDELITTMEMERLPWISFPGGELAPVALSTVQMSMDRSLVAAADRQLRQSQVETSKLDKGELFERTAQQCIQRSLWRAKHPSCKPYSIKIGNAKPDIDIAIIGSRVELIGEAKAMEMPGSVDSAAATFEEQTTKIVGQLQKRLDSLRDGKPVVDGGGTLYYGDDRTIALGVVLHSYSSSLTNAEMLQLLPASLITEHIAIADLQAWVLILATMNSVRQVREYLRFRSDLLSMGVIALDECDLAALFHSPFRESQVSDIRRRLSEYSGPAQIPLGVTTISPEVALKTPTPVDVMSWRNQFYTAARVEPSPI